MHELVAAQHAVARNSTLGRKFVKLSQVKAAKFALSHGCGRINATPGFPEEG